MNVIELMPIRRLAYTERAMDTTQILEGISAKMNEIAREAEEAGDKKKIASEIAARENTKELRKKWEKHIRDREAKGDKLSDDEKREIEELIAKKIGPEIAKIFTSVFTDSQQDPVKRRQDFEAEKNKILGRVKSRDLEGSELRNQIDELKSNLEKDEDRKWIKEMEEDIIKEEAHVSEVLTNAKLTDEERIKKTEDILKRELSDEEKKTIIKAHEVGRDEKGKKEGEKAGVYNYTQKQLREKAEVLKEGGFTRGERRDLLGEGIAGLPAVRFNSIDPAAYSDPDVQDISASVRSGGAVGLGDSEELRYQLSRIDAKVNAGTGNLEEARNLRRQIDVLLRDARQQEIQGAGAELRAALGVAPDAEAAPAAEEETDGEAIGQNFETDIVEKMKKFYVSIKFSEAQADIRAREWAENRKLPQGETLFNPVGFVQEVVEERLHDIEAGNHNDLRQRLRNGDLRSLILNLSPLTVESQRGRISQDDIIAAVRDYTLRLDDILDQTENDTDKLRTLLRKEVFNPINNARDRSIREARGYSPYENINQIANDIMIQRGGDFARDGKYALVKTVNGKEIFQEESFLRWVRDRMIYVHESDTDNPKIDFMSQIYIEGGMKQVRIGDMIQTPAFFTNNEGVYLKDLWQKTYYELWLFNKSRNYDAEYRLVMGSDEKLPETLQKFFYDNTFTKEETFETILTMKTVGEGMPDDNQSTGQALRRALITYYHMQDKHMLNKIEGANPDSTALFNNEAFIRGYIQRKREEGIKDIAAEGEELEEGEVRMSDEQLRAEAFEKVIHKTKGMYNDDGTLIEGNTDRYMDAFNPFNAANKDFDLKNEARERVRLMIMEQEGISYEEAKYAESFAFSMTRWTGLAAKHDFLKLSKGGYSAYDSWTKVLETENYRARQSGPHQGGVHGNPYSLGGFKRMGVDFLEGAKDLKQRSILEIIQGGQGEEVNLDKIEKGSLKFGDRVMEKFGTDHVARVFRLYTDVIDNHEFNFDKIVSIDQFGRVVFDPKAAGEFIDGPLKAFRYGYRTWPGIDYAKKIRARQKDGTFVTTTIGEALWGKQVYMDFVNGKNRDGVYRAQPGDENPGDVMQRQSEPNNREEYWKRPLMYMIAAEIRAHTEFDSGYSKYVYGQISKIYEWLENMSGQLETDENDMSDTRRLKDKMFFSKADIEWIRKVSGTTKGKLLFVEIMTQGSMGLLEGLGTSLKAFFGSLFKT